MIKWLLEIVYAFKLKSELRLSLRKALRFVRRDYLTQEEIRKCWENEDFPERRLVHDY